MGLESRDYMREEAADYGRRRRDAEYNVVGTLIAVNISVFLLQHVIGDVFTDWTQLDPIRTLQGQIWRLTTYDFLHDPNGLMHIFINMFVLWMTGSRLQERLGWREFLAFYLIAGVFSGIGYLAWCLVSSQMVPCIGASGAVAGTIVLYAFFWPDQRWYIYGIFPISSMWLAILYAAFDMYPLVQQLSGMGRDDNVAHAAHVAGMAFAVIYYLGHIRITSMFASRRRFEIYEEAPSSSDAPLSPEEHLLLDALLEKINRSGENSLTDDERAFLADAARRLRSRRS